MAETQQEPTLPPSTNHRPDMVAQGQEFSNDAPPRTPPDVDDLGLPMDVPEDQEEPTLPPHPASIEQDAAPYLVPNKRKRSTILQLMSDSSEMPIFSSDDDPAAENYRDGQGRQKRQYTGSWDRQQPIQDHSPQPESRVKRKFERQVDSGVFLGSDVSADSSFDGLPVRPSASRLGYPQFTQIPRSSRQWVLSPAEAEARRRILHCLETANETIDLSDMNLETISNATVAELKDISPFPHLRRGLPFSTWQPQFKLFLYKNSLSRLPKELFNLNHLTVLSLRANRLTEIPPIILKMINLQELNVSQNSLKCLPMELLELMYSPTSRLETLHIFPNPFRQPELTQPGSDTEGIARHLSDGAEDTIFGNRWLHEGNFFKAKLCARTPVQVSSTRGDVFSAFRTDSGTYLATEDLGSDPTFQTLARPQRTASQPTKVQSLTELVLQSCLRSTEITPEYWRDYYTSDPANAQGFGHIIEALEDMQQQREAGGLQCTVCRRDVVRPTAQWIEWWELWRKIRNDHARPSSFFRPQRDTVQDSPPPLRRSVVEPITTNAAERLVPFLRRACSWKCVKDPVRGLGNPVKTIER